MLFNILKGLFYQPPKTSQPAEQLKQNEDKSKREIEIRQEDQQSKPTAQQNHWMDFF